MSSSEETQRKADIELYRTHTQCTSCKQVRYIVRGGLGHAICYVCEGVPNPKET